MGKINEREKIRALAMALTAKNAAGEVSIVETLSPESSRTKAVVKLLDVLGRKEKSVLLVTAERPSESLLRASSNIRGVEARSAATLSFMDVLSNKFVVFEKRAIDTLKAKAS
jgi:large subunit ribosomal protein L4